MKLIITVKLENEEKKKLEEGIKILAQYCGLVSCDFCMLKSFCNYTYEGSDCAFPDILLDCVEELLE